MRMIDVISAFIFRHSSSNADMQDPLAKEVAAHDATRALLHQERAAHAATRSELARMKEECKALGTQLAQERSKMDEALARIAALSSSLAEMSAARDAETAAHMQATV